MTREQKVVKICAILLATFIIVNIIGAVIYGVESITNRSTNNNAFESSNLNNATSLDISLKTTSLEIMEGKELTIETNNHYVSYKQSDNSISILEDGNSIFTDNNIVKLYIPSTTTFDSVNIETGVGSITIESLNTSNFKLEVGAGKTTITNLKVTNSASINGGAGKMEILSGSINNLNLNMGVGECTITSLLTGYNQIESGVGATNLNLTNSIDNYTIKASKGIGSININGQGLGDETYGTGSSTIAANGGIGSSNITTK